MQALSKAARGTYTIQWIFGIPEVIKQMKKWQIGEGSVIRVIEKYKDSLLIGIDSRRIVIGNEVADRIQV